jgi:hypothetical protein
MEEMKKKNDVKKVVYLLGAGATQAEIRARGGTLGILMGDVVDEIRRKIDKNKIKRLAVTKNELTTEYADVEHLITLYESTGIPKHALIAKDLKRLFKEVIQERTGKLKPTLLSALIDMHRIPQLNEELVCLLTLNYEDILEKAIQEVKGGIDYSIEMNFKHSSLKKGTSTIPLLKLHGSFNWRNEFPITLTDVDKIRNPEDALWIPPGVEKRRERYPFSILWGKAKEVLNCDVLRIVGCSLSRNDWQLVSLLYTAQNLNVHKKDYDIELIDYYDEGEKIKKKYSYIRFRLISDIKEVREYLLKSFKVPPPAEEKLSKDIEGLLSNRTNNIFDIWLKAKGEALRDQNIPITSSTPFFTNYINGVIQ